MPKQSLQIQLCPQRYLFLSRRKSLAVPSNGWASPGLSFHTRSIGPLIFYQVSIKKSHYNQVLLLLMSSLYTTADVRATVTLFGRRETRNGEDYIRVMDIDWHLVDKSSMTFRTDILILNSEILTKLASDVISANWLILFSGPIKQLWENHVKGILNSFYGAIPYRKLFV